MNAKQHKRKTGSFSSALLLGIIFGVFLVVCQELAYQYRLQAQYREYVQLASVFTPPTYATVAPSDITASPEPEITPSPAEGDAQQPTESPQPEENRGPAGYRYEEGSGATIIEIGGEEITIDFAALKSVNPDFTGWFMIPGTDISYPVVQGDDNAFYLDHVFDGSYNKVGALFADYRNVILGDENTIIYGHNFHQYGAMFSKLLYYEDQKWYEEHPVMYYLTEEGGYTIDVLSVYEPKTTDPVYTLAFANAEDYQEFLTHVIESSVIKADVEISTEDKVITLSTCSNKSSRRRFVVVGKVSAFE